MEKKLGADLKKNETITHNSVPWEVIKVFNSLVLENAYCEQIEIENNTEYTLCTKEEFNRYYRE